jgi:hypothetical protein
MMAINVAEVEQGGSVGLPATGFVLQAPPLPVLLLFLILLFTYFSRANTR